MYRLVSFIVIFSFVSIMLYFHNQNGHYKPSNHEHSHSREAAAIPAGGQAPSIEGIIKKDDSGSWLRRIKTGHSRFATEKPGMDNFVVKEQPGSLE